MTKLSELTAATVLDAADEMPIKQSTTSKRSALSLIRNWITSNATGLAVASGTITASAPVTLTQTWNNGAVTFKGLDVNVTDTASNAASLLADFRVGGTSVASVSKTGVALFGLGSNLAPAISFTGDQDTGLFGTAGNAIAIATAGIERVRFNNSGILNPQGYYLGPISTPYSALFPDAAGQIGIRNSTTAQSLAIYTTESSSLTNYERLRIYGTAASAFTIASEAAGTGTVRQIKVSADLLLRPSASVTPPSNGDVAFELTSNTTLTIKVKGSDGTIRSVALTLA